MRLRAGALARRMKKTLSKPRGIVMAVISALLFAPWLVSVAMSSQVDARPPLEQIRRYGPLALFAFTFGSLLFSAGEQALYYSPAEVTFLFAGPYRKRQILAYKLFTTAMLCLFTALFMSLATTMASPRMVSAFVGSFALMLFLQLLQMVTGLAAGTLGALAWSRGRRLILAGLAVVVAMAAVSAGRGLLSAGPIEALETIERSPVATAALTPFRWFVLAFTADRAWPDLARWAGLALLVDLGLVGLVFALEASYLEAASTASARRFARMQRVVGGGGGLRSMTTRRVGRFRFRPPEPPWWGGVGPNFWRQMTGALGDPGRLAGVAMLLSAMPVVVSVIGPGTPRQMEAMPYVCMGVIGWTSVFLSLLIPYDFRGDIDVMEELKTLPISPNRVALGQLLTPTLIATVGQALAMAVVIARVGVGPAGGVVVWSFLAFLLPVNFLFYSLENLLFLWYPSRIIPGQFDIMAAGRMMLFMLAKFLGLGLGAGLAGLAGVAAYFATGRALLPALVVAWAVMAACALAVLPLVGLAFDRFDVSGDIPA